MRYKTIWGYLNAIKKKWLFILLTLFCILFAGWEISYRLYYDFKVYEKFQSPSSEYTLYDGFFVMLWKDEMDAYGSEIIWEVSKVPIIILLIIEIILIFLHYKSILKKT